MIHKSKLTFVGMSFFQRWKFANLGTERFLFRKNNASDAGKSEIQYGNPSDRELFHKRRSPSNQYFGKIAGVGKRFWGVPNKGSLATASGQKSFVRQSLHRIRNRDQTDAKILCNPLAIDQITRTQITAQQQVENVVIGLFGESSAHVRTRRI